MSDRRDESAKSRVGSWVSHALHLFIALLAMGITDGQAQEKDDAEKLRISQVFFAQNHVQASDNPYFKLTCNLEALIKVQVYSDKRASSPGVFAKLQLKGKSLELVLKGPGTLPKSGPDNVLMMEHSFTDSFTAYLPQEWVQPGLQLRLELREAGGTGKVAKVLGRQDFDSLPIGAPTRMKMTMFDIHYFGQANGDYPGAWFPEMGTKLPVASMELRRTRNIVFSQISMPPRDGKLAVICSSREDYEKKTGLKYDGEQGIAGQWKGALREAAGAGWGGTREVWYVNIYGVPCGGTGGGLGGVGNGRDPGILLHELGHGFNLPHWMGVKDYPYVGTMFGIPAESETFPHVGPTWAFDLERKAFISPIENGKWKKDPMQGGGESDHKPYIYKFFSDYSLSRIRKVLEDTQVVYDERSGKYNQWDPKTNAYTAPARQRGAPTVPIEDDVDVISILTSISGPTPSATIIYPPIGPHLSSRIAVPEVSTKSGLASASTLGFSDSNSNACLRVTQGGKQRTYLLKVFINNGANPFDGKGFSTYAINIPAKDGDVTKVELLATPNIFSQGLKADAKVLKTWDGGTEVKTKQSFERVQWPSANHPAKE